jgi:excisionase family DNA binding protein
MDTQTNQPAKLIEPLAVNRVQAAEMLGVSVRTLDTMLVRKEIRCRRIGRRVVLTIEELRRFLTKDHPILADPERDGR